MSAPKWEVSRGKDKKCIDIFHNVREVVAKNGTISYCIIDGDKEYPIIIEAEGCLGGWRGCITISFSNIDTWRAYISIDVYDSANVANNVATAVFLRLVQTLQGVRNQEEINVQLKKVRRIPPSLEEEAWVETSFRRSRQSEENF